MTFFFFNLSYSLMFIGLNNWLLMKIPSLPPPQNQALNSPWFSSRLCRSMSSNTTLRIFPLFHASCSNLMQFSGPATKAYSRWLTLLSRRYHCCQEPVKAIVDDFMGPGDNSLCLKRHKLILKEILLLSSAITHSI